MEPGEFGFELVPLLKWLPDETLFSLASRLHVLWGHPRAWQTSMLLYGAQRAGLHHDFPNALDALIWRTKGQLGTAGQIARQRTLLHYYLPFIHASRIPEFVSSMCGGSVAHLKFRLGLLTSRFRANHPLKACAQCMRDDLAEHGWAYWHLQHQYPGVWICPKHAQPLSESTVKSTGVERFQWNLPSQESLRTPEYDTRFPTIAALGSLGSLVCALVDSRAPEGWFDATRAQLAIRAQCAARGWLTSGGNLRLRAMSESYMHYCQRLRGPCELDSLPITLGGAQTQIGRLFRSMGGGTHPLRILLAVNWLYDGWEAFRVAYEVVPAVQETVLPESSVAGAGQSSDRDPRRSRLSALLRSGLSPTAAARMTGVGVDTALAWATQAGISVSRRPKTLNPPILARLIADLTEGMDKQTVAQRHGVSLQAVTRVLQTEVGLHAAWRHAMQRAAKANARSEWTTLLSDHAAMGPKLLRAMNPALYAWLYRNDRAWLQQMTPPRVPREAYTRRGPVLWDERDRWLSAAVEKSVLQLSLANQGRVLRLWQIYQAVPELKPKLRVLERLPLTKRVIERALSRQVPKQEREDLLG